jgi:hypothetical protein
LGITKNIKRVCIISDSYVPQKISAAGMIYNLSKTIAGHGIEVTCVFSGQKPDDNFNYDIKNIKFITTDIFNSFRQKSLVHRFFFEIATSVVLLIKCICLLPKNHKIDLVIWYGPSVFLWIIVFFIKWVHKMPVYYILRDIFPDWLVNVGLVKNYFIIKILKLLSNPQYYVSDIIGVETIKNIEIIKKKVKKKKKVELLLNWPSLVNQKNSDTLKDRGDSFLTYVNSLSCNKIIGLYIGNASLAHDYVSAFNYFKKIQLTEKMQVDLNIFGKSYNNDHVKNPFFRHTFWGLISEQEIPQILKKSDFGLVTLNTKLVNHNIPGKFVSYCQFGLPILFFGNYNSSLSLLIQKYDCGVIIDLDKSNVSNKIKLNEFLCSLKKNKAYYAKNAIKLFKENFDVNKTIDTIFSHYS